IYLDLNCNTVEVGIRTSYVKTEFRMNAQNTERNEDSRDWLSKPIFQMPVNVAERYNLTDHTKTRFLVDNRIHRIVINVDGNVSSAVLRIPMNATVPWPGTVMTWMRKSDAAGMRIDTSNAPSGEWWIKLTGVDGSNYHITIETFVQEENDMIEDQLFVPEHRLNGATNGVSGAKRGPSIKKSDVTEFDDVKDIDDFVKTLDTKPKGTEKQVSGEFNNVSSLDNSNDSKSPISSNAGKTRIDYVQHATFTDDSENVTTSTNKSSESSDGIISAERQQEIRARSSIPLTDDFDADIRTQTNDASMSMKMVETLDNQELSKELMNYGIENTIEEKQMLIDVNRNSNLIAAPGSVHRVVFDVMNNCILPVRYGFRVKSTPFRVYNLQPTYAWIYPGQMSNVAVDIIIPDNTAPDTANTITLFIQGTEIREKSAYLYVQGSLSKLTDDVKPKIEYSFNNNCLKRVISSPNEIYPHTEFISGTRSPIIFYYSATCCDTTTKITAIDLLNNYNTITLDVTAWNNLSEAQIAAITVGALLLLLLIILIIILIIYCVRRRKSLDLPYTQRTPEFAMSAVATLFSTASTRVGCGTT
ncbi:hypothetical protein WN55_08226, partial [Dufourea novaeangliae]